MTSGEGALPKGWAWSSVGECVDVLDSKRVPLNKDERALRPGDVPYYGATGQVGWIDKPIFDEELVLLGEDGAPFLDPAKPKAYLIAGPSWVNNHAHVLRANHEVTSNRFLLHCLNGCSYEGHVTGTTRLKLNQAAMRAMPLPVPPLAEQERIVAAIEEHLSRLAAAEGAIASARRGLEAFERAAISSLFDRDDWAWTTLGEIGELKGGVTKDAKRQADPSYVEVPYLRVANVQRGFLDLSEVTTIRVAPAKAEQLALCPGDILFNEGGDRDKLGRGSVWEGQIDGCIHQNHVFRARVTSPHFDPHFISMHGNTWGQRWFEQHGKQTTNLASINLGTLKSFPVPAPPLDEQQAVMADLGSLLASEARLTAEVERASSHATALRRSILASAFSGRLVGQDPADEPAEVLLARIAEQWSSADTESKTLARAKTGSSSIRQKESSS